jgi:cytochrome c553
MPNASVLGGYAASDKNRLNTIKATGEYYYRRLIGGTISHFSATGGSDALLCAPAAVVGSANNSPDSTGYILELDYLPWLNTKLQTQYIGYQKFNGGTTNDDSSGRSASIGAAVCAIGIAHGADVTDAIASQNSALHKAIETCGTCHGVDGRIVSPTFPIPARQTAPYIEAQLQGQSLKWKLWLRISSPFRVVQGS